MSSTSYTADENFMLLVEALDIVFFQTKALPSFPSIQLVVTGKGPLKEEYQKVFDKMNQKWKQRINIKTVWLLVDDYPKMV